MKETVPAALASFALMCEDSPTAMALWWPALDCARFNRAWLNQAPHTDAAALWATLNADARAVLANGQALISDALPDDAARSGRYSLHPLREADQAIGVLMLWEPFFVADSVEGWREAASLKALIHEMDLGYCRVELLEAAEGELPDHIYLQANPAFERHSGLSGVLGRRISEISPFREPFWPEAFQQVLATGEVLRTTVRMRRVDRSFKTCIMRVGGPSSRQLAVLLENVTAQHHAAALLQASETAARAAETRARDEHNRLAAVIDATPAAVVVVDRHRRVVWANSASREVWGPFSEGEELKGWVGHWADGSGRHGEPVGASQWPLSRALMGEHAREVLQIKAPQGLRLPHIFLCSAAPIWDAEARIDGAVVIAVDVTDRIEAEQALKDSLAQTDLFLAMLAHELRNPLAPIQMAAELIARDDLPPEDVAQNIAIVARQARHLQGLVDDLLDTARVQRQLLKLDRQMLDLRPLIDEAIEQNQGLISRRGHALVVDVPEDPLPLMGDRKRVVQILVNLLNNAAKYTPDGGRLQIRAQTDEGWLEISVIDNGQGMNSELLRKAFDLFVQAERTPDRQEGGLGLGLSLVKKLVRLHGGLISAHSDGPGQGCRFTVRLPALPPGTVLPEPSSHAASRAPSARRILVVDDNEDAAQTLASYLRACGHFCETAGHAEQALAVTTTPQVYILDIGLPGMDGRQLAQALRDREASTSGRDGRALILALSGYAQPQEQQAALAAGCDHYLVKPVDLERLGALLEQAAPALPRSKPALS